MAHRQTAVRTSLTQPFPSKSHPKRPKSPEMDAIAILASSRPKSIESKLGLSDSARIVLDIVKTAQRTKSRTLECVEVAAQAYHLVNAIDAGVKGHALDINNILQDYIKRLNQDLLALHSALQTLTSRTALLFNSLKRSFSRSRTEATAMKPSKTSPTLEQCKTLLDHKMDMYVLLLRCSLSESEMEKRRSLQRRYTIARNLGRKPSLDYAVRDFRAHGTVERRKGSEDEASAKTWTVGMSTAPLPSWPSSPVPPAKVPKFVEARLPPPTMPDRGLQQPSHQWVHNRTRLVSP